MFCYAGVYDNSADAELAVVGIDNDAEAIERAVTRRGSTCSSTSSATGTRPSRTRSSRLRRLRRLVGAAM